MEDAPNKFKRFSIGKEVRLRGSYCVTCKEVKKDTDGNVIEILCTMIQKLWEKIHLMEEK